MAFSQHILYTGRGLSIPHTVISSAVEKSSLHSALSCFLRKRFPLFRCLTYGAIPVCQKDPSASLGMTLRKRRFPNISFIRDVGYPSPHTVISSAARNLPCTLLFLAPFAKGFQFYFVTHTTLYRCARKIEGFARDDVAEVAFSQHILYTGRGLSIPHTVISSAVEKSSLHSALSCFLRKRFPLFRCLTYGAIPVCQKDPSASLGMTIREERFLSTAFAGYIG